MTKSANSILKDFTTILFFFVLAGVCVGLVTGLRAVVQNAYLSHGMTEILFWTLAKGVDHHLAVFLIVAACNLFLFSILRLCHLSPAKSVSFGLIPFSVIAVIIMYGLPYWPVYRSDPGRLIG